MTAIGSPTGTVLPGSMRRSSTPAYGDSTATVSFSVSTSQIGWPRATSAPVSQSQASRNPSSIVRPSLGITRISAIGFPP